MSVSVRPIHSLLRIASIALCTFAMLSLAPFGATRFVSKASAQPVAVTVEFRTALEPYGTFRRVARWGEVWVPNVATDWRPYTVGRWVYSGDYGWYWVSDAAEAPWGWVAFHYGRWVWIDDIGWAWIPGTQWGPAWVSWRRGPDFLGWAPLPPVDLVADIRDEPQFWIFCRPTDFLATDIATVFIEPQPVLLRETVIVNETVVVRDRGFAVNPGIEPAYIAGFVGHPIPEYEVRPHVLAGTAALPNAIEVRGEDLRSREFRQDLLRQTNIRQTDNRIEPAHNMTRPQPLGPNEHGRLGENPPRAVSGFAQQPPRQPGAIGQAPGQQRGRYEQDAIPERRGFTDRGINERGMNQRGMNDRGINERGMNERGMNAAGPRQEQRLYNRGEAGLPPRSQRGPGEQRGLGSGLGERGASDASPQSRSLQQQRSLGPQQPGFTGRSANPSGGGQGRQMFNGGNAGLPSGGQRGMQDRGAIGPGPEQRSMREPGGGRPGLQQQGRFGASPGGPGAMAPRERGAMSPPSGPPSGQGRELFNRAPGGPISGPQPGAAPRGPSGGGGPGGPGGAGGPGGGPGPGAAAPALRGGGQQHGFERGR